MNLQVGGIFVFMNLVVGEIFVFILLEDVLLKLCISK